LAQATAVTQNRYGGGKIEFNIYLVLLKSYLKLAVAQDPSCTTAAESEQGVC